MFTLKWIAENGAEMIYPARDVSYTPAEAVQPALMTNGSSINPEPVHQLVARDMGRAIVSFYLIGSGDQKSDIHCSIDCGEVYVMNANGRTIANYRLSEILKMAEGAAAIA